MKVLVAAVVLGGAFGVASATVESIEGDVMVIDIEVEVLEEAETVVAHLSFDGEAEAVLPLLDRGEGRFGITTEVEAKNWVVVFEVVGEDGSSSEPRTLHQLGANIGPQPGAPTTTTEQGLSGESERLLWLAVAFGAASLSVLAFWVLVGRDETEEAESERDRDGGVEV